MLVVRSVGYNLARLVQFSGRERRRLFWPYAGCVFLLSVAAMNLALTPLLFGEMARLQRFAATHPNQVTVIQGDGGYTVHIHGQHPEFMPDFRGDLVVVAWTTVAVAALLAAAAARRLHDVGRTALWGLTPLPFLAFGFVAFSRLLDQIAAGPVNAGTFMPAFLALFANNVVYLIALLHLVIQLARSGAAGANRHGPPTTEGLIADGGRPAGGAARA
jgi:uncharacterized membrane protein YhaH (DUF805 family)